MPSSTQGCMPEGLQVDTQREPHIHVALLATIAKLLPKPRYPTDNRNGERGNIHKATSLSCKDEEFMTFSGKQIDLELTLVSEISQIQTNTAHFLSVRIETEICMHTLKLYMT